MGPPRSPGHAALGASRHLAAHPNDEPGPAQMDNGAEENPSRCAEALSGRRRGGRDVWHIWQSVRMVKTTAYLPEADMRALKAAARRRHQSQAELSREGVRRAL